MKLSNLMKCYLFTLLILISQISSANHDDYPVAQQNACANLYNQLTAMEKAYRFSQYSAYDDKLARLAGIVTTSFTPAIIYVGYANYQEFLIEADRKQIFQHLEAIRYELAQQNCFTLK